MINQRWRNDVGRRLADLEIVLGTHRKEMQVRGNKKSPHWPPSRWKGWPWSRRRSWWSKTGGKTLLQWRKDSEGWRSSPGRSSFSFWGVFRFICRVGAARTCHHLLKAGVRCSGKLILCFHLYVAIKSRESGHYFIDPDGPGVGASPVQVLRFGWINFSRISPTWVSSRCTVTCALAQPGWVMIYKESRRWTTAGEFSNSRLKHFNQTMENMWREQRTNSHISWVPQQNKGEKGTNSHLKLNQTKPVKGTRLLCATCKLRASSSTTRLPHSPLRTLWTIYQVCSGKNQRPI